MKNERMIQGEINTLRNICMKMHADGLKDTASYKMMSFELSELFLLVGRTGDAKFWQSQYKKSQGMQDEKEKYNNGDKLKDKWVRFKL